MARPNDQRTYAFTPSVLESEGVVVWFERKPTTKFSWKRLRFVPATLVTEIWSDESGDFEPGHCWIEEIGENDMAWEVKAIVTLSRLPTRKYWYELCKELIKDHKASFMDMAMMIWLRENCKYRYRRVDTFCFEFEDESDATLFKLSWTP